MSLDVTRNVDKCHPGGENVMGLRHCCFGSQPTAPIKLATVSWARPSLTIFVALKVIILSLVFRKSLLLSDHKHLMLSVRRAAEE